MRVRRRTSSKEFAAGLYKSWYNVYYGYYKGTTRSHRVKERIMSTLKVTEVKAGTELDGFDVSYRVTVDAPESDIHGTDIYVSRYPDKAVMKAVVKTAEEPFLGFLVEVEPTVATAAGVKNLERMERSSRLEAIKQAVNAQFDADTAVEMIKTFQG